MLFQKDGRRAYGARFAVESSGSAFRDANGLGRCLDEVDCGEFCPRFCHKFCCEFCEVFDERRRCGCFSRIGADRECECREECREICRRVCQEVCCAHRDSENFCEEFCYDFCKRFCRDFCEEFFELGRSGEVQNACGEDRRVEECREECQERCCRICRRVCEEVLGELDKNFHH